MKTYPTLEDIIWAHTACIEAHGGPPGVRDVQVVDSASARPQATFDGQALYVRFEEQAAALFESLCKNHGFVDGNKRVALATLLGFIDINGYTLETDDDELIDLTLGMAENRYAREDVVRWLEIRLKS